MIFTGLWMNRYQHGQRFDPEPGVLGSKGFTRGKVYWEVKVDRIWWGAEEEEETMKYQGGARGVFGTSDLGGLTGTTDGYSSTACRNENGGGVATGKWNMVEILPGAGGKAVGEEASPLRR